MLSTYINVLEGGSDVANEVRSTLTHIHNMFRCGRTSALTRPPPQRVGYAQAIQGTFLAVAAIPGKRSRSLNDKVVPGRAGLHL